jgi:cation:H+ antiporter
VSISIALIVFLGSLILSMMSSAVVAERLEQVGERLRFPAGLLGLVTALGADSPEITSALTALIGGQHDLGRGVIYGSNIFNLAFLLGSSALVAGVTVIGRANLILNGGAALAVTLIVGAQSAGLIGVTLTGLLLAVAVIPYFAVLSMNPNKLSLLPLPAFIACWLVAAITSEQRDESADKRSDRSAGGGRLTTADALSILPLLSVIVASSIGLVKAAEVLGARWSVSQLVMGTFVVATLTGLPNLIASIRLATKGRGAALSSEAFNSNTLNLLVGAYLPTFFVGVPPLPHEGLVSMLWLAAMTTLALVIGIAGRGFGRWTGGLIIALYAAFAVAVLH